MPGYVVRRPVLLEWCIEHGVRYREQPLCEVADISPRTMRKVLNGEPVSPRVIRELLRVTGLERDALVAPVAPPEPEPEPERLRAVI
jgi:hypothetical protein